MTEQQTPEEVLLLVPARHLQPGDHLWGYSVYQMRVREDGSREWGLVEPFTTKSFSLIVEERKLDELSFPITKRGDAHNTAPRNKALGLPEKLHQNVYVETKVDPIASYPVGTRVKDVKHFDRSQKVLFACPTHPESAWAAKDPYVSTYFPQSENTRDCRASYSHRCLVPLTEYVLTHEYLPTRNG